MLGVRLEPQIEASLASIARRTRRTKSDIVREAIGQYVRRNDEAYLAEARRQSLHAAAHDDDGDWEFWEGISAWNDKA